MKANTRSLLYIARRMRQHWPKGKCHWTRQDIANEVRSYLRHNAHEAVRFHYSQGDALYGSM